MTGQGPTILQCPSCGATQRIEENESTIICQFCGNSILIPPEFRINKTTPPPVRTPPVRTPPPVSAEEPAPEGKVVITTQDTRTRASLIVWLAVGLILCVGLFLFVAAAGGDSLFSSGSSRQNPPNVVSTPGKEQGPLAPALPTFTPIAELLLKFGQEGEAEGQFDDPRFIAVDPSGNIFVGDYSGGRVQKFDPQGNFLMLINVPAPDQGSDIYTRGIGADSQGRLYVSRNGEILVYNSTDGSLINTIPNGWPDTYYDSLHVAGDILYTTNGMAGTDDILKLSPDGEILLHRQEVIESVDDDDPALNMQIAVDPGGQIYILSNFGPHVYVYDAQGEYLYRFGEEGDGRGMLNLGSDLLAVDTRGRLYVVSSYRIDQFDAQGNYLDYSIDVYDDSDNGVPMGMTFDAQGYLYLVCNNGRVLKYQINSR